MSRSLSEAVAELPPSAKLVVKVLQHADTALTQQELADRTWLAQRTARYALNRLLEQDLVDKRWNSQDARQHLYELTAAAKPDDAT